MFTHELTRLALVMVANRNKRKKPSGCLGLAWRAISHPILHNLMMQCLRHQVIPPSILLSYSRLVPGPAPSHALKSARNNTAVSPLCCCILGKTPKTLRGRLQFVQEAVFRYMHKQDKTRRHKSQIVIFHVDQTEGQ